MLSEKIQKRTICLDVCVVHSIIGLDKTTYDKTSFAVSALKGF